MTSAERTQYELDQWSLSYDAKRIVLLPGDGVGPEVVEAAREVLEAVSEAFDRRFHFDERPIGAAALASAGTPLPAEVLEACMDADAILLGAVGGSPPGAEPRPEEGLLALRSALGLYANLRPVRAGAARWRLTAAGAGGARGFDVLIVRELTGGLYYGHPRGMTTQRASNGATVGRAVNSMVYSSEEIERVAEVAFRLAAGRRGKVASVDKANVLEVSRLWRATVEEVAAGHPDVELEHLYVDNAAFQLVRDPSRFDVLLTENLFGDILSDLAGGLAGSIALVPSASLGARTGLFEPVHGTASELAGTGRANPVGAVLSAALLLRHAFGWEEEAGAVERAVEETLAAGWHTPDLALGGGGARWARRLTGTRGMAERIAATVRGSGGRSAVRAAASRGLCGTA